MKKNKKKKKRVSPLEKIIYFFGIATSVILIVLIVCSRTYLAQINLEVQKLEKEVNNAKDTNESLNMKIDEMTSLDKIEEISEEYGLSYNSDNIKTID